MVDPIQFPLKSLFEKVNNSLEGLVDARIGAKTSRNLRMRMAGMMATTAVVVMIPVVDLEE